MIDPSEFDTYPFRHGDELAVVPPEEAAKLPTTWGTFIVPDGEGHSIRVPPRLEFFHFKGFDLPVHLVERTGGGPETFEEIAASHIANLQRFAGIDPSMTIVEVGCGIGRDALQLIDLLDEHGRYIGVDVVRDSIMWCTNNISKTHPNFSFHHVDAYSELYNPFGTQRTTHIKLPVDDRSVDRVTGMSLFTHLLEDETVHYLHEFRRMLKPSGLIYVTFFRYSPEALAAASKTQLLPFRASFEHAYGGGFYGNDAVYPRGAVAFTDEALERMVSKAGLRLVRSLKGSWSGLHEDADEGQDGAILGIA